MKRILYISILNTNKNVLPFDGVMKKILMHIRVLKGYGNTVDYIESNGVDTFFVTGENKTKICDFLEGGYKYFNNVVINTAKYIVDNSLYYDYVYIRHDAFSYKGFKALSKISTHSKRVYLEIPTYFVPAFTIKNFIKYYFNRYLKKYVYKIVTDCNEKTIYGMDTVMITNGVEVEKIKTRQPSNDTNINVALVASISDYHGVNKIVDAVENEPDFSNVVFHIAGEGPKYAEYVKTVTDKGLQNRIKLYGKLAGEELDELFNKCEIGISSLANKEIGVLFSSTLKSKEYLSKGIPIISDVMLDVFYENPQYFFYQLKDNFNLHELVDFYNSVYENRDKQSVINDIRNYAERTCDIRIVMKKLEDDFQQSLVL